MFSRLSQWAAVGLLVSVTAAGLVSPAKAELEQGTTLVLAAPAQNVDLRGYVKGAVALFKTVGDRDSNQKRCMGYGSLTPDHTIEIQQKTSQMTLQLRTKQQDTTLVVEGPNNRLYCSDDSAGGGKDAELVLSDLSSGSYKVWIGAFEPGAGFRYTLNVRSQP
ncbi:hypothetical protein [Altericista sp. CCNU0014]|uniref:hypothetical protein n=1 Tax=Altericista sp. CCNU0014 TaxID=3082949 RepID=UPI0038514B1A